MPNRTYPWRRFELSVDSLNWLNRIFYRNGIINGLKVFADGSLEKGIFIVNGYIWEELSNVAAFNFTPLLNQPSETSNVIYARYTYTDTDIHANAVYGFANALPIDSVRLGIITVPPNSAAVTDSMLLTTDVHRDMSAVYRSAGDTKPVVEDMTGRADVTNRVFELSAKPLVGSVSVSVNGLRAALDYDFTIDNITSLITFDYDVGRTETILIEYIPDKLN